jgi:hypothetical protein
LRMRDTDGNALNVDRSHFAGGQRQTQ